MKLLYQVDNLLALKLNVVRKASTDVVVVRILHHEPKAFWSAIIVLCGEIVV